MKKIKLGEDSYERLKSALINEISVGLADNANRVSDKIFWHVKNAFDSSMMSLRIPCSILDGIWMIIR